MNVASKRRRFRALLAGDQCLVPASIYDPLSARAAEEIGYELAFMAGSVASLTVLGAPDLVIVTLSELVEQARRIARATNLPFFLDADHGFGNALSVMRTVEELESAGLAGLTIEDTALPARFDQKGSPPHSLAEGLGKMKAALAARQDPDFVIIGRTGAAASTGLDDCLERVLAYQDAGVDAIFLSGLKTREDIEACANICRVPLLLGALPGYLSKPDMLSGLGVRSLITGHRPHSAAVRATYETLREARAGTLPPRPEDEGPLMDRLSRKAAYEAHSKAFLKPEGKP
ncbi:MAG: isocitrate lyase/PEP mutase family protein [Beijerinckiaceae bacterium]|nr:isocitrate lyase/PEP mutase family protein [Beijerinckiaceae bacterium]